MDESEEMREPFTWNCLFFRPARCLSQKLREKSKFREGRSIGPSVLTSALKMPENRRDLKTYVIVLRD
jgi:hypothetical protein